jgi:hypothetical protein
MQMQLSVLVYRNNYFSIDIRPTEASSTVFRRLHTFLFMPVILGETNGDFRLTMMYGRHR